MKNEAVLCLYQVINVVIKTQVFLFSYSINYSFSKYASCSGGSVYNIKLLVSTITGICVVYVYRSLQGMLHLLNT